MNLEFSIGTHDLEIPVFGSLEQSALLSGELVDDEFI